MVAYNKPSVNLAEIQAHMKVIIGCVLLLWLYSATSIASETQQNPNNVFCNNSSHFLNEYIPAKAFSTEMQNETRIGALKIQNNANNISIFEGDVLIEQDKFVLQADHMIFDQNQQRLDINDNIRINTPQLQAQAHSGWFNLKTKSGRFLNNQYQIPDSGFQGKTEDLSMQSQQYSELLNTQFSSCPVAQQDWYLAMKKLNLNYQNDTGTAQHASLWFKGVPIFYWPYLSFPIGDERRSGFLMPSISNSSSRGTELVVPWYWNIAANQDALFTPRYMSKHGAQIGTAYRYLGQHSNAQLNLEILPNDKQTNTDRYSISLKQQNQINENSRVELLFNDLSDSEYFQDLGNSIYSRNTINVERKASFIHNTRIWTSRLSAQSFKTIDDSIALDNRPYRRLPQLQISGQDRFSYNSDINWSLDTEWVNFSHESDNKTTGQRIDLYPKIIWPLTGDSWFFTASSGYRLTQYNVTDNNNDKIQLDTRKLNISSLDAGLFFERNLYNNTWIQTLEPRLFYLHIPFEEQNNIPLFDTKNISDFSFSQLFRENRFNGIDRMGDANQLSIALSSRFLDVTQGKEIASIQLGQIFYNTPQRVGLNANNTEFDTRSALIAEASASLHNWRTSLTLQWNSKSRQTDKRLYQLSYAKDNENIFNLGYRFRRNTNEALNLEQSDISFRWPLAQGYALLSRWNYSLTDKRDIDKIFGLEYESCCWSLRLIAQSYLSDVANEIYDNSIRFQLIFKGFGSISDRKTNDILKRAIIGYQPDK